MPAGLRDLVRDIAGLGAQPSFRDTLRGGQRNAEIVDSYRFVPSRSAMFWFVSGRAASWDGLQVAAALGRGPGRPVLG
jgi:hypothetical protein